MSDISLPNGWGEQPLSSLIAKLESGVSVNAEDRACGADEIGVLKTSCVNGGRFEPRENKVVLKRSEILRAELNPRKGSILVSRMNTFDLVGENAYVDRDYSNLFVPDRLWQTVLRSDDTTSAKWLSFVIRSPLFRHSVSNAATGTSGSMKNISQWSYLAIQVRVPPLPEQRKIARILTAVDSLIEKTEALIAKYQAIKQGMMHDLFTRGVDEHGHLRPPYEEAPELYKQSELGWIPREWETRSLNELVSPGRPIAYGILMPGYGHPGGVPVIKVKDIKNGVVDENDLLLTSPEIDFAYRRSRVKSGDLLFTIRGTVGRTALVPPSLAGANITQDTARIAIVGSDVRFLRGYLNMPYPRRFIECHTLGVAVQGINLRDVRRIRIAFPQAKEQERLGNILDTLEYVICQEQEQLAKLAKKQIGLMQDLLTGRVGVKVGEAEEVSRV
jgi:type I restriction enzyme S subunit